MLSIGYVRVLTDRQADQGVSLEAQDAKVRAMVTVQGAKLLDVIVDGGESAKSLNRPGLQRLLSLVNGGKVQSVNVAKLDRRLAAHGKHVEPDPGEQAILAEIQRLRK
jgi:site-specific DNA recombinase